MSTLANWSYTQPLTVWPLTATDAYGQPTFGTPYIIMGSWMVGGDTVTAYDGAQFTATSKYYFEMEPTDSDLPKRGGYICRGNKTNVANPLQAGAEQIRKVEGYDVGMFGANEIPDWIVYT